MFVLVKQLSLFYGFFEYKIWRFGINLDERITFSLFVLVITGVFLLVFLPIWRPGMYLDGVIYAAISRNMAAGIGSLAVPHFTNTLFPHFFEHPSLGLWLQSLLFRLLGDHLYVERLFVSIEFIVVSFFIVYLWAKSFSSIRASNLVDD